MLNPWLGIGLVLSIFAMLTAGRHAFRRFRLVDPEFLRKLFHVGMGIVALAAPWLFTSSWPVLVLTAMFVLGMSARRVLPSLRGILGEAIDGVGRRSLGEVWFPLGVGLLFLISGGDPLTFCIPMLILTFADAAAALVGARYGALRLLPGRGEKSLEGSLAFFSLAFLSTLVPLLLFTETGRAETLLIALSLGLQTMLLEALSTNGMDNLFIPLGAFVLLKTFLELDLAAVAVGTAMAIITILCTLVWTNARRADREDRSGTVFRQAVRRRA